MKDTPEEYCPQEEIITVVYPAQKFSPIPYHSFEVGSIYYKTFVKQDETVEDAYKRAWEFVQTKAREQFENVREEFLSRFKDSNAKVKKLAEEEDIFG